MAGLDHQQTIDLCEDPGESFRDVSGDPVTPERLREIAALADSLFDQSTLEEKVWDTLHLPAHVSARRLSRLSQPERAEILLRLPAHLTEELVSILPVSVV